MPKSLFLIDSSALAYRSFYAFINNPLMNSEGQQTSAIYGYASQVLRLLEDVQPDYFAVVRDLPKPTFRHKMYKEYKAQRKPMPIELKTQMPIIEDFIKVAGFPDICLEGYEADDLMGTLAKIAGKEDVLTFLVTRDKDMMQIVDEKTFMYETGGRNDPAVVRGSKEVKAKFEVDPEQMVDLLALMGDASDNIPGVSKVGQKTAARLLNTYGNLDGIYENVDNISQKGLRNNLINDKEKAYMSRDLVLLNCDVKVKFKMKDLAFDSFPSKEMNEFLKKWELNSLLQHVPGKVVQKPVEEKKKKAPKSKYRLANEQTSLDELLAELKQAPVIALDTETTGLDVLTADLVGLCFSTAEKKGWYVPVKHDEGGNIALGVLQKKLGPLLKDKTKKFVFHNAKYDLPILERHALAPALKGKDQLIDTLIAAFLDNPGSRGLSLDALALKHFNHEMISIESVIGKKGKNQKTFSQVPLEEACEYGAEDADITFRLWKVYEKILKKKKDLDLMFNDELPLLHVLLKMEHEGIKVNKAAFKKLSTTISDEIAGREKKIFKLAGEEFNINSPQKLSEILFEKLKLKTGKKTKTGYSTDASVLLGLKGSHDIIENLLDYREFSKLKNTYIDVLPALVHPETDRVHTSFSQTIAATGRLSSISPNLQNIPIRTDWGKKIRACFVPSSKEKVLLAADYSQIELRVLAHLSGDESLVDAYQNNVDIHKRTAAGIYNVEESEVDSDMRRNAKVVNFGVLYGMGPSRLSRELEIERWKAQEFIYNYFETYASVRDYMDYVIDDARRLGYVTTITGRKRYLPELASSNRMFKENAERMAVNTPIQGTAADLIKRAMVQVDKALTKSKVDCQMLLQVHDELVFEVDKNDIEESSTIIRACMESSMDLIVPLLVDIGYGSNWLKAHG